MPYGDFKDFPRKTAPDKIFSDKAFTIAKIPKYDGYQRRLAFCFWHFLRHSDIKKWKLHCEQASENKNIL